MFPTLVKRGIPPTIDAAFDYYGGYARPAIPLDPSRIALMIYWSTARKAYVTAQLGQADCTIDGDRWPVASEVLDQTTWHRKVCVCPFPGDDRHALLFEASDPMKPQFLGLVLRTYAETSFHEQVDAVLEGRPADEARALQSFAAHAAAHPEDMQEVGAAVEGMFKEVADQMNAMSADANIRGSTSARDRMDAATRPSTNATQPSLRLRTN
jgi:hypothetical protein